MTLSGCMIMQPRALFLLFYYSSDKILLCHVPQTSEKPLSTMTGHSGPVTGVKLSLPFALSAAGCAVRLWDVTQGTCLKLLQHDEDSPVTTMTWTSTFKAGCVKFKGESDSSRK